MTSYYEGFLKAVSHKRRDTELIKTMIENDEYNVDVKKKLFSNMNVRLKEIIKDNKSVSPVSKLSHNLSKFESALDSVD